jgi:hypothetical protein
MTWKEALASGICPRDGTVADYSINMKESDGERYVEDWLCPSCGYRWQLIYTLTGIADQGRFRLLGE